MLREEPEVVADRAAQVVGRVAVVVQMQLDLTQPAPRQLGERVEISGLVFLAGEKERVARGSPIGVAEARREGRIPVRPGAHARGADGTILRLPERFVVVAESEEEVPWPRCFGAVAP